GDGGPAAVVDQFGKQVREQGVGGGRAGLVERVLPVVADAGAQGQASLGERVADVAARDLLGEAHVSLAGDLDDGVSPAVVDGRGLVAGVGGGGARRILPVGEAELELVLAAHPLREVVAVEVDDVPLHAGGEV